MFGGNYFDEELYHRALCSFARKKTFYIVSIVSVQAGEMVKCKQ